MKNIVEGPNWPERIYVIGDEAFVCTNNFLIPYSGKVSLIQAIPFYKIIVYHYALLIFFCYIKDEPLVIQKIISIFY